MTTSAVVGRSKITDMEIDFFVDKKAELSYLTSPVGVGIIVSGINENVCLGEQACVPCLRALGRPDVVVVKD